MGVAEDLGQIVDGPARHFGRFQCAEPVCFAPGLHGRGQQGHQHLTVAHPGLVCRILGVQGQVVHAGHGAKFEKLVVVAHGQNQMVFFTGF